jgi:hypothetical protein
MTIAGGIIGFVAVIGGAALIARWISRGSPKMVKLAQAIARESGDDAAVVVASRARVDKTLDLGKTMVDLSKTVNVGSYTVDLGEASALPGAVANGNGVAAQMYDQFNKLANQMLALQRSGQTAALRDTALRAKYALGKSGEVTFLEFAEGVLWFYIKKNGPALRSAGRYNEYIAVLKAMQETLGAWAVDIP